MKINTITSEEFEKARKPQRRGNRVQLIEEIRKVATDTKNRGKKFEIKFDNGKESLSLSSFHYLKKQLSKDIKEMRYDPLKDDSKHVQAVLFECNN